MSSSKSRSVWSLTPEAFERLLLRLNPNRDIAAKEFEAQRRYLIQLFQYAGASDPDHLADVTFDRAAKRLAEGEQVEDLHAWLRGAARLVFQEERTRLSRQINALRSSSPQDREHLETEAKHEILNDCLNRLGVQDRQLIERYYQHDNESLTDARKRLASELAIPIENLRVRALRLRKALEDCFRSAFNESEPG